MPVRNGLTIFYFVSFLFTAGSLLIAAPRIWCALAETFVSPWTCMCMWVWVFRDRHHVWSVFLLHDPIKVGKEPAVIWWLKGDSLTFLGNRGWWRLKMIQHDWSPIEPEEGEGKGLAADNKTWERPLNKAAVVHFSGQEKAWREIGLVNGVKLIGKRRDNLSESAVIVSSL